MAETNTFWGTFQKKWKHLLENTWSKHFDSPMDPFPLHGKTKPLSLVLFQRNQNLKNSLVFNVLSPPTCKTVKEKRKKAKICSPTGHAVLCTAHTQTQTACKKGLQLLLKPHTFPGWRDGSWDTHLSIPPSHPPPSLLPFSILPHFPTCLLLSSASPLSSSTPYPFSFQTHCSPLSSYSSSFPSGPKQDGFVSSPFKCLALCSMQNILLAPPNESLCRSGAQTFTYLPLMWVILRESAFESSVLFMLLVNGYACWRNV